MSAAVSFALGAAAVLMWTCPPLDVLRLDRPSGFVYVGTAFGQLVVEVHGRGIVVGERFGPNRGGSRAGVRLLRYRSTDRPNWVVACRVPLPLVAGVAAVIPAGWAVLWWRRERAGVRA